MVSKEKKLAAKPEVPAMTAQPIRDGDHVLDEKTAAAIDRRLIETVRIALRVSRVDRIPMPLRETLVRGFASGLRVEHTLIPAATAPASTAYKPFHSCGTLNAKLRWA